MIQRNYKDKAEKFTPQVNNAKSTKTKSKLHKKMLFKDAVSLPTHGFTRILSHHIVPDSTSNSSISTGRKGTSKRTLKIFLVTLSIAKNTNNTIAVGKAVNALIKVIHRIEGDTNKVKMASWK